jgi:hypothetical protein
MLLCGESWEISIVVAPGAATGLLWTWFRVRVDGSAGVVERLSGVF